MQSFFSTVMSVLSFTRTVMNGVFAILRLILSVITCAIESWKSSKIWCDVYVALLPPLKLASSTTPINYSHSNISWYLLFDISYLTRKDTVCNAFSTAACFLLVTDSSVLFIAA